MADSPRRRPSRALAGHARPRDVARPPRALVAKPKANTREIGSGRGLSGWWGMLDEESTPELRWPLSIDVYERMRSQDAQVGSVLRAVTLPIRRTPWRLAPNGAPDEVVALIAEDLGLPIVGSSAAPLKRTRDRFSWDEHLRLALLMLPFGHSYFEQVYRLEETTGYLRLRKLGPRLPKTIAKINVADDGGLISIEQHGRGPTGKPAVIPVSALVAYVLEREGDNWLGRSLLRQAYKNWLIKDRLLRTQAQTVDRNGMGVPIYEGAQGEDDLDAGQEIASSVRAGDNAGAAIPHGAKLRLAGVEGDLPDADKPIRYHDEQIARAVLAHFLNLGTQTGSWALGTTFADFFTQSLQAVALQVADVATQHIVEDLVDLNFGPDVQAPRVTFDEIGSRRHLTAEAIKVLTDAGVIRSDDDLEEFVRSIYGLPARSDDATDRTGA